jgi:hypothetical protein
MITACALLRTGILAEHQQARSDITSAGIDSQVNRSLCRETQLLSVTYRPRGCCMAPTVLLVGREGGHCRSSVITRNAHRPLAISRNHAHHHLNFQQGNTRLPWVLRADGRLQALEQVRQSKASLDCPQPGILILPSYIGTTPLAVVAVVLAHCRHKQ